jgi:hypothetical protein
VTRKELKATDQIIISLPKWDRESERPESMLQADSQGALKCEGLNTYIAASACPVVFGEDEDTVILSNSLTADVPAGRTLLFKFGPVKNPISSREQSGFQLLIKDQEGGRVMASQAILKITEPATVDAS